MRYRHLCFVLVALVLLIAVPSLRQEFSPIVVKTGKPTPSVVRSGEPFKITYTAEFFDTVLISEDQMQPGSLALDNIEVIGLEIMKHRPEEYANLGIVNVWDFIYTFRIINPDKKVYKVPPFNFIWAEKKAGVTKEETGEKEKPREFPTDEVSVGYVSSIVGPVVLRDAMIYVSPVASSGKLRLWAYLVMGTAFLSVLVILYLFSRRLSKTRKFEEAVSKDDKISVESAVVDREPLLSPKKARKKFLQELDKLKQEMLRPVLLNNSDESESAQVLKSKLISLEKKLRFLVRSLLLAEQSQILQDSLSENEIYQRLNSLDAKQRRKLGSQYDFALGLALRLKGYQEDIDLENYSLNLTKEVSELETAVMARHSKGRALIPLLIVGALLVLLLIWGVQ